MNNIKRLHENMKGYSEILDRVSKDLNDVIFEIELTKIDLHPIQCKKLESAEEMVTSMSGAIMHSTEKYIIASVTEGD